MISHTSDMRSMTNRVSNHFPWDSNFNIIIFNPSFLTLAPFVYQLPNAARKVGMGKNEKDAF